MARLFPLRATDVPPDAGPKGWLYVLTNHTIADHLKIGCSCTNLWERVRQLQAQTANAGQFILELFYVTEAVKEHERNIFAVLDRFRINKRREFFVGSAEFAYYTLKEYFAREPDWVHPRLQEVLQS